MSENLNLSKTIVMPDPSDGTSTKEYNINAVYSDEAGKVTTPLVIRESLATRLSEGSFNGDKAESTKQEINYVPASGGKFTGAIYIADSEKDLSIDHKVITSGQINNRFEKIQGATLYAWNNDDEQLLFALSNSNNQYQKLTVLSGTMASFKILKQLLSEGRQGTTPGINYVVDRDSDGVNPVSCRAWASNGLGTTDLTTTDIIVPYYYTFEDTNKTGKTYRLPVIGLYSGAFRNKITIKKVILPDSVTSISQEAFSGCSSLESIILPIGIKSINKQAFKGCSALTAINIRGTEINTIGDEAFLNCTSLKTLIIPKSVTSIGSNILEGCSGDLTVYYTGSEADWAHINISGNNTKLKSVSINYNYSTLDTSTAISLGQVHDDPFIYICNDENSDESPVSNKVFLKLPGSSELVEISKGADRLNSTIVDSNNYYTYEGLAEIIARINARLDAIGGEDLKIKTTAFAPLHDVEEINALITEEDKKETLATAIIPTVQDLQTAIIKMSGRTVAESDSTSKIYTFINDTTNTDSLANLREDLTALETEVLYELNGGETALGVTLDYTNSRIDKAEDILNLNDITGKYSTRTVGGLSAGKITSTSITELLKTILGIKAGQAPANLSITIYKAGTTEEVKDLTAALNENALAIDVTWSLNGGTYTGNYTNSLSGSNINTDSMSSLVTETATSGTITGITTTLAGNHTFASITYTAAYNAFSDVSSGQLRQTAGITIYRNCYYGINGQTLTTVPSTSVDGWPFTVTLDNQKAVFMYPASWRSSDQIKITDANGFDVTGQFTSGTVAENGGSYLKYILNSNNTGTFTYTVTYID